MKRVSGMRTPKMRCRPSSGSAPNSPPETCGRCTWRGCRPTECGSAMRTPSTRKTRTCGNRRVPAGLQSLTAAQRALADFLRLDADLLDVAAEASPPRPAVQDDPGALAARIASLPDGEKGRLLLLVAQDQGARAKKELLRKFRGDPESGGSSPRRRVGTLLDTAALHRQ